MTAARAEDVRSVEEFRALYYPEADPALDYFDGAGPDNGSGVEDSDDAAVLGLDPLDLFGRLVDQHD